MLSPIMTESETYRQRRSYHALEGAAASVTRKLEAGLPMSFTERCDLALFISLLAIMR